MFFNSLHFDNMIWEDIAEMPDFPPDTDNDDWSFQSRLNWHLEDYLESRPTKELALAGDTNPLPTALHFLESAAGTLTSLNLDWLITRRTDNGAADDARDARTAFHQIFTLRFPCLRAFQLRNCVVKESALPDGLYLLDECSTDLLPGFEEIGKVQSAS